MAWGSDEHDGYGRGIFARRFSSNGAGLATEFQVNTYTTYDQSRPALALDADGDFVVVWDSIAQDDGDDTGVFGQRFASAGAAIGLEFLVNVHTPDLQVSADVDMDADGDFVVAWGSQNQDGSSHGIFARRFSSSGASLGEFPVNTYTTGTRSFRPWEWTRAVTSG